MQEGDVVKLIVPPFCIGEIDYIARDTYCDVVVLKPVPRWGKVVVGLKDVKLVEAKNNGK